jgi:mannose-1-phosphate guanylyltransferase
MKEDWDRIAIIIAGGIGERFWPLSRLLRPKQLLPFGPGGATLLEDTVKRIKPLIPPESIYIVTGRMLQEPIRAAGLAVPADNVIAEPARRNTAGALVFASSYLLARRGGVAREAILAILPADHLIEDAEAFRADVSIAMDVVAERGGLAVIGIPPARPETGYGYVELAEEDARNVEDETTPTALRVAAFKEKPDAGTASRYATSGRHFWNSGMFFWRMNDFLDELRTAAPDHFNVVEPLALALREEKEEEAKSLFERLEDISIDYVLMERARKVWMIPAAFYWDDMGAWDSLRRAGEMDAEGNVALGDSIRVDTRDCIVVNDAGGEAISVALVGVEGLTVVVTDDGVLVSRTNRVQDVREAVKLLKEKGSPHV